LRKPTGVAVTRREVVRLINRSLRMAGLTVTLALVVSFSWSQQKTSQPRPKADSPSPSVLPTKGWVERGTYKNPSIGLEFTPAPNLSVEDPEMKGTPGTTPLLITVQATDRGLLSGVFSRKNLTVFFADALAYYPEDQRNTARYVRKVIKSNEGDGYQTVNDGTAGEISGVPFTRTDFELNDLREAVLVTTHNGYAFVFIFAGSSLEVVNNQIASTSVKLIP
jgi:hypothetical protein